MHDPISSITDNKALVTAYLEAFSSGDVERIGTYLHNDLRWWVTGTVPGISGTYNRDETLKLLAQVTQIYKQGALRLWPVSMLGEGQRLAVEAQSYAELHNGKIYNNFYHIFFELADGKIIRMNEYMDTRHVHDTFIEKA